MKSGGSSRDLVFFLFLSGRGDYLCSRLLDSSSNPDDGRVFYCVKKTGAPAIVFVVIP